METDSCIFILIAVAFLYFILKQEQRENFVSVVPAQPTKCFSCERALPDKLKYLSGPSKCFSCEQDLLHRNPPRPAGLAQPSKCFSCEKQMLYFR
jgi:hypothetical protein|tara:strand:+ start:551 stop:835 length:285 start_codon:yes stop_codon:yes gene_type:complete